MEGILMLGIAGTFLYGAWKFLLVVRSRIQLRRARRQVVQNAAHQQQQRVQQASRQTAARRRQREESIRRINAVYRALQIAIQQITQAPDFQRAATVAAQCGAVPVSYRRRQFRRYRPLIVTTLAKRLAAGGDLEMLTRSLTDLVAALGVSDFEADYILQEVQSHERNSQNEQGEGYGSRLRKLELEHRQRVSAIEALSQQDAAIKQQLLEAENNRFHEEMLGTTDSPALSSDDVSI